MYRIAIATLLVVTIPIHAQEPIRFARSPALSPDGKTVAFSYLGDLWTVDAKGGVATQLTRHEKHDYNPVFSPDGQWIAFSSNRHGQYDVFVVPVKGGRANRLTFDSADDHVTGWSPDSKHVLFSSGREFELTLRIELYSVPVEGGAVKRITAWEGRDGAYSPKGDVIAYVRGPGAWNRRGYHGSSNDDIWLSNADGTNNRRFTSHNGQDSYPQWSADGKSLFYVSDVTGGLSNIVKQDLDGGKPVAVTSHKDDFVRRARIGANGQAIVYECGFDLWIHSIKEGKSAKLKIEVNADDQTNPDTIKTFSNGASEFVWSPDEKFCAIVVHGEIFLVGGKGGKGKRLTEHPAFDHGVAWSPDGKRLLFLSDRSGHEDIYSLEPDDPDHPTLIAAHKYKVKQLTNSPESESGVHFSPDGNHVTFVRAGKLLRMDPDGKNERVLVADGQVIDYEWSPDSRWICYSRMDGSFASELYIIPAGGATPQDPARNITRFATFNSGVTWSKSGNRLAFISMRRGIGFSAHVLLLQKPAPAGAKPSTDIDWDNIHQRVKAPAGLGMIVKECAINADGTMIAFRGATEESEDLWMAKTDGGSVQRLTTGNLNPTQIQWSRFFNGQIYFRDKDGSYRSVMVGGPQVVGPTSLNFTARMAINRQDLYLEIFDQSWRALNEEYYDANFHGADWRSIRGKYRDIVKHCAHKEDLYTLVTLMLGELNSSHLGITGAPTQPEQQTAELGLIFDRSHTGSTLKIAEILKGGPADRRGIPLNRGDVITAIDGVLLTPKANVSKLLNDKVGEVVVLTVNDSTGVRRRVEVRGDSRAKLNAPMYERWVANNAARVSELSKGKLGYIHILNMQENGLERFVRALYSDNFDKEGIVLDVRYNGGGFTHDQVINYLIGKEHTIFTHRDGTPTLVVRSYDRKWTKPLTLLINNRSFSDAEVFANAFRTLGLGKVVGQATGGSVIFTRNIALIDGSIFRTPRIGVHTLKGVNMEKEGVMPDIAIDAHPDDLARGNDVQLDRAVSVLTQDVLAWKKSRPPMAGGAGANNP